MLSRVIQCYDTRQRGQSQRPPTPDTHHLCYNPLVDERAFIEQKKDSWTSLSQVLDQVRKRGPGSLSGQQLASLGAQYRAVVSDLSFARSQGASGELVAYLNELAGRAHGVIYAAPTAKLSGAAAFLLRDFPALFRSTSRYALVAALIFFIGWGIAAYLIHTESAAGSQFIPEEFFGQPEGPVQVPDPAQMSSYIMTNNIQVGIMSFAAGMTAGVLTVYVLYSNGRMIGAIATLWAPRLGHARFWALILPHGVIELAAIFICGGAGLMLGSAIIAPGNLRRADSIRIAAGKALRLFAGTLPFFVIAAIIEGFITPSVIPTWSKLAFSGVTALALILYLGFSGRTSTIVRDL